MFPFSRVAARNGATPRSAHRAARWWHFAGWALLSTLIFLGLWQSNWRWSAFFDNAALDALFVLRGPHSPKEVAEKLPQSRDILIIELRHDTPRDVLAQLLPKLKMARAVGLDLMFADRRAQLSEAEIPLYAREIARWKSEDESLSRAIKAAKNVVIGTWNERVSSGATASQNQFHWSLPVAALDKAARARAHLGVVPDVQDGLIRRVRLFETIENRPTPALGLALAARARGESAAQLAQKRARPSPRDGGALIINYLGPRAVWEGDRNRVVFESAFDFDPADFAGKIILIGQTDDRSKDILPTPFGDMPGLFVHANIVATLLDAGGAPQVLSPLFIGAIALGLCWILVATLTRFPVWMCAPVALLEMGIAAGVSGWLFCHFNRIMPLSVPFGALFLTYNGVAIYEYLRARRTLGLVVGAGTAAQLLDDLQGPQRGGKTQIATAFFCDLRGYSTFSEQLSTEELTALLDRYTALVVREVHAQGGRPIDYFGDGVFVLFEAKKGSNHARQAVRAALATQRALAAPIPALAGQSNQKTARKIGSQTGANTRQVSLPNADEIGAAGENGAAMKPRLVAGIALHTGPMMIGFVGSDAHLKPGAVGDAVNVAARLQSLSELCGFPILLSRATLEACNQPDALEDEAPVEATFCGEFPVKGRRGTVDVFGLDAT